MKTQVAIIGSATRDRIVDGAESRLKWGGGVVYAGMTLSRLGVVAGVLTNIATRDRRLLDLLSGAGIAVEAGDSERTTEFVNHVSGDARRQELLACASPISQSQVAAITARAEDVYLGSLHPFDIEPEAVEALRQGVRRVAVDIQGYTRQVVGREVYSGVSEHVRSVLAQADIVKASREETEAVESFCGQPLTAILREFDIEQWLTTDGTRGGWVLDQSGARHDFSAVPVEQVADPTGAGDVFFAAYQASHLYEGTGIDEALHEASALTARHVQGRFITADELVRDNPQATSRSRS